MLSSRSANTSSVSFPQVARRFTRKRRAWKRRALVMELLEPRMVLDSTTVINELMYHPSDDATPEWVELYNQLSVDMDLSNWSLSGGIEYDFPAGTTIPGGGFVVVSSAPVRLAEAVGIEALGPFRGNLANNGESIELRDINDRLMSVLDYRDDGEWPVGPDGSGATLAKRDEMTATEEPTNWSTSAQLGGTPGNVNYPDIPIVSRALISMHDTWRYDDSGTDWGSRWRMPDFDDGHWKSGGALLFDTPADLPGNKTTPLENGRNTYYFRTRFEYDGSLEAAEQFRLSPIVDDGAVIYLNGEEIFRLRMPAGPITFDTMATESVTDAVRLDEIRLPADGLVVGTNVLAVEVHQSATGDLPVELANGSFEADRSDPLFGPSGWTTMGVAFGGLNRVTLRDHAGSAGTNPPYPDGGQALVVRSNDGQPLSIRQDLGTVSKETYRVSFSVADRTLSQWLNYEVALLAVDGDNETVIVGGDSATDPALRPINGSVSHPQPASLIGNQGDWLDILLQGDAGPELAGQTLRIQFTTTAHSTGDSNGESFEFALDNVGVSIRQSTNDTDAAFGTDLIVDEMLSPPAAADLTISEIAFGAADEFWIEVYNAGDREIPLNGVTLSRSGFESFTFPAQTMSAGEFLVLDEATLGFDAQVGDRLFLMSDQSSVIDARAVAGTPTALELAEPHRWIVPSETTPNAPNRFELSDQIVINEIMYHQRPTLSTPTIPGTFETSEALSFDAAWRYNAAGAAVDANWHNVVHPLGGDWQEGTGLIGFAPDPQALPRPIGTELNNPANNSPRVTTYYFETEFSLSQTDLNDLDEFRLRHVIDDGAVFYLNGSEVLRFNMTNDEITSSTFATASITDVGISNFVSIPTELLRLGDNRISVEVHQASNFSPDIVFGAELTTAVQQTSAIPGSPFAEDDEEWIELYNRGDGAVDLSGWEFVDGIRYEFPPGTLLAPHEYLVVARDANILRQKYPELSRVTGNLDGRLSNRGERLLLLDQRGNPADEVRYFDGGVWDDRSDGNGPSLELRNPHSDNASGSAWAASDEAVDSQWHTYTYRGPAPATIPGEPNLWNEFALGFLDGPGEALIDDVSVIENPDGAAIELIQNGTFDQGDAHWRLLGNHQRSAVINDDGNSVLHFKSSGATEYQWNQVETTFLDDRSLVEGEIYQVSFRARWLSGSRQINSRLYFNRLPHTTVLTVGDQTGTPGRPNSRLVANAAPTYSELTHDPAIPEPGEPIMVSVRASDPDGLASMTLWHRDDGDQWTSTPMTVIDGRFSAMIPGKPAATITQFYVEGTDLLGATSVFPAAGSDSRALVKVNDGQGVDGSLHEFRVIMLADDANWLHASTNVLSNERQGATVVFENEIYYDVGVRLKGSFVGRDVPRVGFNIAFKPDQLFRGVHDKVSVDRSMHALIGVDEILIKHVANHAGGIPNMYDDLIHFIAPRPQNSGNGLLRMAGFDEVYLDSQFENGSDGTLYEYEVPRWAINTLDGNPESLKLAGTLGAPNGFANVEIQDLGDDKEAYRWTNLIVSNRTRDDYRSIIQMGKAFSAEGDELFTATRDILDIDQWMRTAAYQSLLGPSDAYFTGSNIHNFRLYVRPDDGKVLYMPWDWDSSFQRSTSARLVGGGRLGQIVNFPANLRLFFGHMLDIVESTYNEAYMSTWAEHYGGLAGQDFTNRLRYIDRRSDFVVGAVRDEFPEIEFGVTTPTSTVVDDTSITVTGTGWVNVREIRLAQRDESLELEWLTGAGGNADTWTTTVPLPFGASVLTFEAYDFQGQLIGSEVIEVESTVSNRPLNDFLRITELHYNPDGSDATEFIELANISSGASATTIDLSGVWLADGPAEPFVIPTGIVLAPGAYALIVANQQAFEAAYPEVDSQTILGEYAGSLDNGGERIALTDDVGNEIVTFTYADGGLWPEAADGVGASLELVDPATTSLEQIDKYYSWRSSSEIGGSPGRAGNGPFGVIINEVLARTEPAISDAIELHNTTSAPIDIGGWFLSDSSNDLLKYEIPAGTVLAAGGYAVFDEQDFNPTPLSPSPRDFALNGAEGDDVWLVIPREFGGVATIVDDVHFRSTFNGTTFGVTEHSNGRLVPLTRNTVGCRNGQPLVDDVVFRTIHYLPGAPTAAALAIEPNLDGNDLEYLVVSGRSQSLLGWRIRGGVDFDFPDSSSTVPMTWIVSFDPESPANLSKLAAFRAHHGLPESTLIIGGYSGSLSNRGEQLRLERPDEPPIDDPSVTPYVTVDEVIYDDQAPWPLPVRGDPIVRRASMFFGNDGALWAHGSTFDGGDNVLGDFNGDGAADAADIDLLFDAVNRESQNSDFVLSGAGPVADALEIDFYVHDLLGTAFGDANLDGVVDAIDYGVWSDHRFRSCTGWSSGDFNGDGKTDGSDFNVWNDHKFLALAADSAAGDVTTTPRQPLPVAEAISTSTLASSSSPGIDTRVADEHVYVSKRVQRHGQAAATETLAEAGLSGRWRQYRVRSTRADRTWQTPVHRLEVVDCLFAELDEWEFADCR